MRDGIDVQPLPLRRGELGEEDVALVACESDVNFPSSQDLCAVKSLHRRSGCLC